MKMTLDLIEENIMWSIFIADPHEQAFAEFSELRRTYTESGHERFETTFREIFGAAFYQAWLDWQRWHMPTLISPALKSSPR